MQATALPCAPDATPDAEAPFVPLSDDALREHLKGRGFDLSLYPHATLGNGTLTLRLWNLSGQLVGFQAYTPGRAKEKDRTRLPRELRYFTFRSCYSAPKRAEHAERPRADARAEEKELAVWGLETLRPGAALFLAEGVFDACRLHALGLSAVAVLGNDPQILAPWLRALPHQRVALCDGDSAGRRLAKLGHVALRAPDGKDPGDLSDGELRQLLAAYL